VSHAILKAVAAGSVVLGALFASSGANSQQPTVAPCYCICATTPSGLWGELHAAAPRGCQSLVGKSCRVLDRVTRGVSPGRTITCGPAAAAAAFAPGGIPQR
jgi:hypothetical protein